MAETVQFNLERLLPAVKDLESLKLFNKPELKEIMKRRTDFEYTLRKRSPPKSEYLAYIEFEMNLEELRKQRKEKKKIVGDKHLSDYAGIQHIYYIFDRLVTKYKGDEHLWLQYIQAIRKYNSFTALSKVFARAIQALPLEPIFWILSASWEYEHNGNMGSARSLLQRALRLMPENEKLWQEYFRLELLFLEKILSRRRVLKLDGNNSTHRNNDAMEEDEESDEEQQQRDPETAINVPVLSQERDAKKTTSNFSGGNGINSESFLRGDISIIIHDNAIKAIPNSVSFRAKFIEIARQFTVGPRLEKHIYACVARDFEKDPIGRSLVAEKGFWDHDLLKMDKKTFIKIAEPVYKNYKKALEEVPILEMWEYYIQFFEKCIPLISKKNKELLQYLIQKQLEIYPNLESQGLIDAKNFLNWALLLQSQGSEDEAKQVLQRGCAAFPNSVELWIECIEDSPESERSELFKKAKQSVPAAEKPVLMQHYLDFQVSILQKNFAPWPKMESLIMEVTQSVPFSSSVVLSILRHTFELFDINIFRKCYLLLEHRSLALSLEFFAYCIERELTQVKKSVKYIRKLFEMAISFDPTCKDLWIQYIMFEGNHGDVNEVSKIYWRGLQVVNRKEDYAREYSAIDWNKYQFQPFA